MNFALSQEPGINREVGYGKPPIEHRFKPGNRANPHGRPPGRSLTALLRQALQAEDDLGRGTAAERIAGTLIHRAIGGHFQAIKIILDRTEGKVTERPRDVFDPETEPGVPTWDRVERAIIDALEPFEDARIAVAAALHELAREARDHDGSVGDSER